MTNQLANDKIFLKMTQKILKEVSWGIIGAGDVCERKSGPPLMQTTNSTVKAVMRRNSDKAKDFAKRHGIEMRMIY